MPIADNSRINETMRKSQASFYGILSLLLGDKEFLDSLKRDRKNT